MRQGEFVESSGMKLNVPFESDRQAPFLPVHPIYIDAYLKC